MSITVFAVALVVGAALIALWVDMRIPSLAPSDLKLVGVHGLVALIAIQMIPGAGSSAVSVFVALFGAALPALVYFLLIAIWFLRYAQGVLGFGSR